MSMTIEEIEAYRHLSNEELHAMGRCRKCFKISPSAGAWLCQECLDYAMQVAREACR